MRVQKSVLAAQFFELFGLARLYLELLSQVSRHTTELALTIYHKSIHNSRLPWHVHRDWSQPEAAVQGVGRVCNLWDPVRLGSIIDRAREIGHMRRPGPIWSSMTATVAMPSYDILTIMCRIHVHCGLSNC